MNNKTKPQSKPFQQFQGDTNRNNQNRQCLVCGDEATAFNFGGLSCDCCKVFFRRNANAYSNNPKCFHRCQITLANRRKCCPKCRLEKCFDIGMKKQLIHTRKACNDTNKDELLNSVLIRERTFNQHELNAHELEQLCEIQSAMSIFTNENEQQLLGVLENCCEFFKLRRLYTKKIVKFSQSIASFKALNERDQLVMLKQFHPVISCIRVAFIYDTKRNGFNQIVNEIGDQVVFIPTAENRSGTVSGLNWFCRNFLRFSHDILGHDCALKDLTIAYMLFKPRLNLSNIEFIRYQHLVYGRLIHRYIEVFVPANELENKYSALMKMLHDLDYVRCSIEHILGEVDLLGLEAHLINEKDT